MLTAVQKEILQTLINLYKKSDGKSIKGEEIAALMNRNPGTIRNQMQSLRSLGLVKGVPGPRGGYKPTIKAFQYLEISPVEMKAQVPIYKNGEKLEDLSVSKIEFTSIPHPGECEAAIKVVGSIKNLNLGDRIRVGPTPVNKLVVDGIIVGRDDMDNMVLLDTTGIRSIPQKTVMEVATQDLVTIEPEMSLKEVAKILSEKNIEGAPVTEDDKIVGMLTLSDINRAIAEGKEQCKVAEIMSTSIVTVDKTVMISDAIEIMNKHNIGRLILVDSEKRPIGIVTRTDILDAISGLKNR
ncbi:MAG TPA: CBS domain-containing protein [Methanobacteriales archaeon]|nr:MAG: Inosine-5'-monophosphate dehydrogenase related protein VII [Methanobacteriaceae archaeon 41_258]MBC7089082.1 CBS domain-containing protein [Methanobacteriaceae archaeon]MBC7096438.1 CBS domain-containing protein [Methanobacteriales archaeon]HIH62451.1 CBS domain-containing protein [Methanobacteriales archaeon]